MFRVLKTAAEQRAIFRQAGLVFRPHPERAYGKLRRAKGTAQESPQSVGVGAVYGRCFEHREEGNHRRGELSTAGRAGKTHGSKPMAFLKMSEAGHSEHVRTE